MTNDKHVPCLIRHPKSIQAGRVIDKPVMHTDFMPTLLDYAGLESPKDIDGRSLMEGEDVEWRDCHLLEKFMNTTRNPNHTVKNKEEFYWVMGVKDGRYKYLCHRFNDNFHNKQYQSAAVCRPARTW